MKRFKSYKALQILFKMRFSVFAIGVTVLLHSVFYLVVITAVPHSARLNSQTANPDFMPPIYVELNWLPLNTLINTAENGASKEDLQRVETNKVMEGGRYYLPSELSQPVRVLQGLAEDFFIPIRQPVILAIYINEDGFVDHILVEDKGLLTDQEVSELIKAFTNVVYHPGIRGEKVVKALYRVKLEVNRKTLIQY